QRASRRKVRFQQESEPRVRVRMDALVHVLHQGEQCVDLLCVGDPQDPDQGAWPSIERAEFSLVDGGADYAESVVSVPASPATSPGIPPQPLADEWVSQVPDLDATPMTTPVRKPQDPKQRGAPVFHISEVSPYPPPPPAPAPQRRANGDSRPGQQEQRPSSSGSSHYESHTQASYSRARARATDRAAIYGPDHASVMPSTLSRRRSTSFTEDSPFACSSPGRPASVIGTGASPRRSLADMFRDPGMPGSMRAHSSMGFASHRSALHSLDTVLTEQQPVLKEPSSPGMGSQWSQAIGGSEGGSSLCVFDTDDQRGVFVARIREPRRVQISVWFSVLAQPAASDKLPVNEHAANSPMASASAMTIFPWESGSVTLHGLPRSLNTRVCIRLPHRRTLLGDDGDDIVLLSFPGPNDLTSDMLTTPRRRVMKVDMSDAPSTMRRAGICRGPLPEFSPQGLPGDGCFYRIRMTQPSRSEPTGSRVMDARLASAEAIGRKGKPASITAHGWLSTDDSDTQPGRDDLMQQLCQDSDTLLDRRLQRHIDETADDLATYAPPVSIQVDEFGSPQPVAAKINGKRQEWDAFAQDQTRAEGFDYSKTELTTYKLKSVDMVTLAWSPRLVEYCQPIDEPAQAPAEEKGDEQLAPRKPLAPPAELFGLETIMSTSTTPSNSVRARSDEPAARLSTDRVFEALAKPVAVAAGKPVVDSVDVRVRVCPQFLGLLTRVVLSLETAGGASSVAQWPESVSIDFAALQLMIPGCSSTTGRQPLLSVGYQHKSVIMESSGLVQTPLWAVDKSSPSSLRVWVPATVGSASPIVLEVESTTQVGVGVRGMQLTDRVCLAVPERIISLPTTSSSAGAKVAVDNMSDLWVSASLADHDASVSEALSALNGAGQEYFVVDIIRQGVSQSPSAQHLRLASALSSFEASELPCICPSQLDIDVSMVSGSPAAAGLMVTVTLVCTLTSLDPWFVQMRQPPPGSSTRTACLAIRTPAISDSNLWVLDHVNVSGDNGGTPLAPLITGSQMLVVLPIRTTNSSAEAALGDEVAVDTVKCVFSASLSDVRDKATLPLPLPLLDLSDSGMADLSVDLDKVAHVRFARRSRHLLSSTRLSLAVPSSASWRMAQPVLVGTDTVSCPIDLSADSTLLATHRLYLSLDSSLALQLYRPEPPRELVSRYVETEPVVNGVRKLVSKDSAASLPFSLSASEAEDEERDDISPATTASGSPMIVEMAEDNGAAEVPQQQQQEQEPATETDALLGGRDSVGARTEQDTGKGVLNMLWRAIKWAVKVFLYLTVTAILLYVASDYLEMQSPPPLDMHVQPIAAAPLLPTETTIAAALQQSSASPSESTGVAHPLDITLVGGRETSTLHSGPRVRVRGKSRIKPMRGGPHSADGAQSTSPDSMTGWWVYSAVLEPILDFIKELW
ncbi:hypothetical protein EC988_001993, partial [Linderina pennispora]